MGAFDSAGIWAGLKLRISGLVLFILLLVLPWPVFANGLSGGNGIVNLATGWSYTSGAVLAGEADTATWTPLEHLADAPNDVETLGSQIISYRIILPELTCRDCVLLIENVRRDFAVYLDGQLQAYYGEPERPDVPGAVGRAVVWLQLAPDASGRELIMNVRSDSTFVGINGNVWIGDADDLNRLLLEKGWQSLLSAFLSFVMGFVVFFVFFPQRREGVYLFFGFAAMIIGCALISSVEWIRMISDEPVLFDLIEYFGVYLIGPTVWLYIRAQFLPDARWPWLVIAIQLAPVLLILLAMEFNGFPPNVWISQMQLLLLLSMLMLLGVLSVLAYRGNRNARLVLGSFLLVMSMGILEVLMLFMSFSSDLIFLPFAAPLFIFSQLLILAQRWVQLNRELEELNANLELRVADRTAKVRTLLDNVSEGFMTVNPDRAVDEEHSAACNLLLGREAAGALLEEILYPDKSDDQSLMADVLQEAFRCQSAQDRELYLSLLPREVSLNGRVLGLVYRPIADPSQHTMVKVLLMIQDLTETRRLEQQLVNEEQLLRMIITVLAKPDDYLDLLNDYRTFVNVELPAMAESKHVSEDDLVLVLRLVHTFKGNFAQFGSKEFVSALHWFEQTLARDGDEQVKDCLNRAQNLPWLDTLEEELKRMQAIVPMPWLTQSKETVSVDRKLLQQLKEYIVSTLPEDVSAPLTSQLDRLVQLPFVSLFDSLRTYAQQLSDRLGKLIEPMQLVGGNFSVDPDRWRPWVKSLVHVVRNQMDHGIETLDERVEVGKPDAGHLMIEMKKLPGFIIVSFYDDGAGIDEERLRLLLVEKGLISSEQAETMPQEQLYACLFLDEVSTKDKVSELSGRGVGLAKVREETERLGGTIEVKSERGKGTEMTFVFPI